MVQAKADDLNLYFRKNCIHLQTRFTELLDATQMPLVFLHGNPHLDNFAKTNQGEAMVDFDRSRFGPYAWDLVRFLSSLALKEQIAREAEGTVALDRGLNPKLREVFRDGYLTGFEAPFQNLLVPEVLPDSRPSESERSTRAYLDSNLNWAKKMRENPVFVSHPTVQSLVELYFKGRNEFGELSQYLIEEAGTAVGSFGRTRILVVLAHKSAEASDKILLELKEAYQDPDRLPFFNPFIHHGFRMIEASHLYAEGFEMRLSFLTWRHRQYWARQIPPFKSKLPKNLTETQRESLAYRVGVQLGKAHRKSIRDVTPQRLLAHLRDQYGTFIEVALKMNQEIRSQYETLHHFDGAVEGSSDHQSSLVQLKVARK